MEAARVVAAVFGAIYVLLGLIGFAVGTPLFGLFEVNDFGNLVHVAVGLALGFGVTSAATAIRITRRVGAILVVLGLLGFLSADGFGFMPLGGNDIWLHLSTGAVLLANGIFETDDVPAA
jgi:hypothetical protein